MDAKLKAKWVKALRSGRYKQTRGALRRKVKGEYRYCCLGVLCKIQRADFSKLDMGTVYVLASMNDGDFTGKRHSFNEIADFIERNL